MRYDAARGEGAVYGRSSARRLAGGARNEKDAL
jgi:hypothetical protein